MNDKDQRADLAMKYPDEGGLPEQVRDYDDTEGVAALLKKLFFEKE